MVEATSRAARKSSSGTSMKKGKVPVPEKKKKPKQSRQCAEPAAESPSYRLALRSLFSCRNSSHAPAAAPPPSDRSSSKSKQQLGCSSAPSICKANNRSSSTKAPPPDDATAAKRRASVSGGSSERCVKKPPLLSLDSKLQGSSSSSSSTGGGSFRAGMQLRRLSGCYECHMVVDPSSSMRAAICSCPDCGEIFVRQESLQLHQSIRHAVCELGSDDTSRNIIEIIFQSSWLKKQSPVCRVERILKVHNSARTLARFEEYRDAVKAKARKKHPRCTADGNELLRFHCAALGCALGLHGATHLCGACAACAIIRDGFTTTDAAGGIRTMATSGRAHDACVVEDADEQSSTSSTSSRAMLVCRVIAGRVKRPEEEEVHDHDAEEEEEEEYESVASSAGVYSNMEELQVFNPRAILPCFVVIYSYKAAAP